MARTVRLDAMRNEIRWLADVKGLTVRHSDTDLNRAINQSIQRLRLKVSNKGIRNYLTNSAGTLTVGPTSPFAFTVIDLASLNPVRVFGLDVTVQGRIRSLEEVDFASRNDFQSGDRGTSPTTDVPLAFAVYQNTKLAILPASNGAYAYTAWYLPTLADLTADADTFDGVAGWELWVQWDVHVKLINRDKYGQDYALAVQEREMAWADIEANSNPVKTGNVVKRYDARGLRGDSLMRRRRETL